jgi:hypothetical protein
MLQTTVEDKHIARYKLLKIIATTVFEFTFLCAFSILLMVLQKLA